MADSSSSSVSPVHRLSSMADDILEKANQMMQERKRFDEERLREMEKQPRCALLPSPDILETAKFQGEDVTDTLVDYANVLDWVTKRGLFDTSFSSPDYPEKIKKKSKLSESNFKVTIHSAFNHAFSAILHTGSLDAQELVLWYYAGHGLGTVNIMNNKLHESSAIPRLEKAGINVKVRRSVASQFMPEPSTRTLKGGELCLHDVGFCDIHGVLEGWIAALKGKSQNIDDPEQHVRHNKHLVLILDSCYSGIFADDLRMLTKGQHPWNENGCTVTIQASCGAEEPTFGGYFTPMFLHLNQCPEDLNQFKEEWLQLNKEEKEFYSSYPIPSPEVATTRNDEGDHSLVRKIECQNFSMVLFPDAPFFKYCFLSKFRKLNLECDRAWTNDLKNKFLQQPSFQVLDYKLKKLSSYAKLFAGTPMGLFLVENHDDAGYVVCVHIHFRSNNTEIGNISRINLAHHLRPGPGQPIYVEERSEWKIRINKQSQEAQNLVEACHDEVENCESGRWDDASRWNMRDNELGVKQLFRLNQRSKDMDKYLESLNLKASSHRCSLFYNCQVTKHLKSVVIHVMMFCIVSYLMFLAGMLNFNYDFFDLT